MKATALHRYEARAEVAKALGHPTRLLLLDSLSGRQMSVGELTRLVGADQSTVSKHLAILKNAGFVVSRKVGSTAYYSVNCKCLDGFFRCMESVLEGNLRAQKAALGR